jgi:hypothetical protein
MTVGYFGDTSDVSVGFTAEATFKTTPATPAWSRVRINSESLVYNIENKVSGELQPNASVPDLIQVGASVGGDLSGELSYGTNFRVLLAAALRGAEATNVLKRGLLKPSFSIEKKFDAGNVTQYMRFLGCRADGLSLSFKAKDIITWKMPFVGCLGSPIAQAIVTGATYVDEVQKPVMSAPEVASLTVGGATVGVTYTELTIDVKNNCRMQNGIGALAAAGVGYGTTEITGTMKAYFDDAVLYNLFVAGTASSLTFAVADPLTNGFTFLVSNLKYKTGKIVAQGKNNDIFVEFTWQGLWNAATSTDFCITTTGTAV